MNREEAEALGWQFDDSGAASKWFGTHYKEAGSLEAVEELERINKQREDAVRAAQLAEAEELEERIKELRGESTTEESK